MSEPDSSAGPELALATTAPETALAPVLPQHPTVNSYSVSQIVTIAKMVSEALTLPKPLQGKPADVLAVMLAGRELGIGPMQATRQIEIIQGQTVLRAELKLALARRAGHDIRPIARSRRCVRVKCLSCGSHEIEWALEAEDALNLEDAVIASAIQVEAWEGDSGNRRKVLRPLVEKSNWQSWDFAMLWARACAQLCREHCPEAVGGLYSAEELGAGGDE